MRRVIIDTDPGIDDAAAILLALASPELRVECLTIVYGNGSLDACALNARRILQAAHRQDIPIYRGAGCPLLRPPTPGWASQVHGVDALGDAGLPLPPEPDPTLGQPPAAWEIVRRVRDAPGEITILALGRLTNLALAFSLAPEIVRQVAQVVVMGGAIAVPGNVSPVATANLYEDPEAAAIVYEAGAPLVQMGLDVCDQVEIGAAQLERLRQADTPATRLLLAATPCLQASYRRRKLLRDTSGVRYNDLPAVAWAIDPSLFWAEPLRVTIETRSELTRGQTVAHRRNLAGQSPNAQVALGVNAPLLTELFTRRLAGCRG